MPIPKVFASPADGPIPLPHYVGNEPQAAGSSKKRPADVLDDFESLTPHQKKVRLAAMERENARCRKLKADKLCHVLNKREVQCDRCGSHIKLSLKNCYDAEHWVKHRKLCLKRPDHVVAELRAASNLGPRKPSCTPELTEDGASETSATSTCIKSEPATSPAPSRPPSPRPAATPWLDARRHNDAHPLSTQALCAGYMAVAHPDAAPFDPAGFPSLDAVLEEMQAWTPARVKPGACFVADVEEAKLRLRTPAQWPPAASETSDDEGGDEEAQAWPPRSSPPPS
ncbi:hypothetical protein BD413DRAFT_691165 [Trametes elegans]|nr:hypothetical protein BD413DRAFT_691165 [Trametes elegans]